MVRKSRNRLKVLRASYHDGRGITQMDLAPKAGLSRDRYWRIENGYEQPTETELARLAKALKVDASELGLTPSRAVA